MTRFHALSTVYRSGVANEGKIGIVGGFSGPPGPFNVQDNLGWHCADDFEGNGTFGGDCQENDYGITIADYLCCK